MNKLYQQNFYFLFAFPILSSLLTHTARIFDSIRKSWHSIEQMRGLYRGNFCSCSRAKAHIKEKYRVYPQNIHRVLIAYSSSILKMKCVLMDTFNKRNNIRNYVPSIFQVYTVTKIMLIFGDRVLKY